MNKNKHENNDVLLGFGAVRGACGSFVAESHDASSCCHIHPAIIPCPESVRAVLVAELTIHLYYFSAFLPELLGLPLKQKYCTRQTNNRNRHVL